VKSWMLATLALTGCAQNAFLELQFRLPADDGSGWWAIAMLGSPTEPSTALEGMEFQAIQLDASPRWDCMSVQSHVAGEDLEARVRFCHQPDCLGFDDDRIPPLVYRIERPFYIGRRTYWSAEIDRVARPCTSDKQCQGGGPESPSGVCVLTDPADGVCGCRVDADCCEGDSCLCLNGPCFSCEESVCVRNVDVCEVEGCRAGDLGALGFCEPDGTHVCESRPSVDLPGSFWCALPED
jgi:hypothetical protein